MTDFPLVHLPPDKVPERLSQTLLAHYDNCPRSAYLYRLYDGGGDAHNKFRGTAIHETIARLTNHMLQHGEPRVDGDLAKTVLEEVLTENPAWVIPEAEQDAARMMVWHWAEGTVLPLENVAAVERTFVMDIAGWEVRGRIDLLLLYDGVAEVRDYKSAYPPSAEDSSEPSFQTAVYSLLVAEGFPLDDDENRLPSLGTGLHSFLPRVVYPRVLCDDGTLLTRGPSEPVRRAQLLEFRGDLERKVRQFDRALNTGEWPAVNGTHCDYCPARIECPLPDTLLGFDGSIQTMEDAEHTANAVHVLELLVKDAKKALRGFAEPGGLSIRVGSDRVFEFSKKESWSTDWDALEAVAAEGVPVQLDQFRKRRVSTGFAARKLTKGELNGGSDGVDAGNGGEHGDGGRAGGAVEPAGARFGDTAPF